ncbi:Gfo/Idh/MocA family protein [Algisphaera agarilytica]|uniref:Putative dehydrogenase n=1 Tax=Algisphaera agarilytica TaxID=1385975 RepID=A0A7X0H4Y4_9BACT|nr:Gfo/Idh/MocA family oxidoreductase [Algisphaera agarilytica]MBB6429368.1 putative dehydrogenase [Algisphaera agarilytica]
MSKPTASQPLGLGVLGLGEGRSVISAALSSDRWQLRVLCDLDEELCKERCVEFDFDRYTLSYEDMLADAAVDVVAIYTPDRFHADHIEQALAAGKHVICTKPLIDDLKDAPRLLELAASADRHVFVGQSTRFFEGFMRQRAEFDAGVLGELVTLETHYHADHRWFIDKPMTDPSRYKPLFGGGSHPVDLVRWYLPDIDTVVAYGDMSPNGADVGLVHPDTIHALFRAADGRVAHTSGCYNTPVEPSDFTSEIRCTLRGAQGASHADYPELRYARSAAGKPHHVETYEDKRSHYFRFGGHSHHAGEYQNYIDFFADHLAEGKTPQPGLIEGIGTVAVMAALEHSMATGKQIVMSDFLTAHGLPGDLLAPRD